MRIAEPKLAGAQLFGLADMLPYTGVPTDSFVAVDDATMNQWLGETYRAESKGDNVPRQQPTHEMVNGVWVPIAEPS